MSRAYDGQYQPLAEFDPNKQLQFALDKAVKELGGGLFDLVDLVFEAAQERIKEVIEALIGFEVPNPDDLIDEVRSWASSIPAEIVADIYEKTGIDFSSFPNFLFSLDDGKGIDLTAISRILHALQGIDLTKPGAVLAAILSSIRKGGLVPLGWISDRSQNMIYEGGFDGPETISEDSGFTHDDTDGVPGSHPLGCALVECDGELHLMATAELIEVGPGWSLEISHAARWQDLVTTGPDTWPIRVELVPFHKPENSDIFTAVGGPVRVTGVESPTGTSAGWQGAFMGPWTVPGDGSVTHIGLRPQVTEDALSGVVKIDNVKVAAVQKLPQRYTLDLPEDLLSLWNGLGSLVDQLLTRLGIPPVGSLLDKIFDLSDELEWIQSRAQSAHDDLNTLILNLLTNPGAVLGQLGMGKVTGLLDFQATQNQIRDILAGEVVTPINSVVQDIKDWWTGLTGKTSKLTSGGQLDAANLLNQDALDIVAAVKDGAAGVANTFTGAAEQAYTGLLDLLGLASMARDAALAAQAQLQDITNDTEAPPELDGLVWSTTFAGAVNTALSSGDWAPVASLVIKENNQVGVGPSNETPEDGHYWALSKHVYVTDGQSASAVLGSARGSNAGADHSTGIYLRCDDGFTTGAYAHFRDGQIVIGKFARSGSVFTFTPLSSVSVGVKAGDLVRFRAYGNVYYGLVNGIVRIQVTDAGNIIDIGEDYRRAAMSCERKRYWDFFSSWTRDSYRIASWAQSDWLPAGVSVTTPAWRLRRATGDEVARAVGHGGQEPMPAGFYTSADLSEQVTVSDLGTGQVAITKDGWYELVASSTNRDTYLVNPGHTTAGGDLRDAWRPSLWVLIVDGVPVAGPVMSGTPVTVYLAAGQVVRPGVSASWPTYPVDSRYRTSSNNYNDYQNNPARSAITHVSGSPSASFTGRKVA